MINLFKKPEITIVKDEEGKVKYIKYDDNINVRYETIKPHLIKKEQNEMIDVNDLERRISNLEIMNGSSEYAVYRDDDGKEIFKQGIPDKPLNFPDTDSHRWG